MNQQSWIELLRLGPDRQARRGPQCPDEGLLALYRDGELSEADRSVMQTHLPDCDHCLRAISLLMLLETDEVPQEVPEELQRRAASPSPNEPTRWRTQHWRWAAAAVLIASISILWLHFGSESMSRPPGIDPPDERLQGSFSGAPRLLFPTPGGVLPSDAIRFDWAAVPGAASYSLRIVSSEGDLLFEETVLETRSVVPSDVRLDPGQTYFVRVSALLSGGKRLDSEHVRFSIEDSD